MIKLKISEVKIVALIIAVIFILVVLNSVFKDYVSYQVKTLELRSSQKKLKGLENKHDDLLKQLDAFKADRQKLESRLFNKDGIALFLQRMPKEAAQSGVRVLRLRADKRFKSVKASSSSGKKAEVNSKSGPVLMYLPIETVIQGPLSSVEDFLIDLEKDHQLVTVTNVNINAKKYPLIEGNFILTAFTLDEDQ